MKRFFLCALLVCAPLLHAASFSNGQAARAEFGQFFFNAAQGGPSNQVLAGPSGVAVANGTLFVADGNVLGANDGVDAYGNAVTGNRVMMFYTSEIPSLTADLSQGPLVNTLCPVCGFAAVNEVGQVDYQSYIASSFTTSSGGTPQGHPSQQGYSNGTPGNISSMWNPSGVASDGQVLAVADTQNNRVLIWNSIPTNLNAPANVVLGQPDFQVLQPSSAINATTLRGPQGLWIQNGKLFVADTGNNRILIWNHIPTTNNAAADLVLGQAGFNAVSSPSVINTVATAKQLWSPTGVSSDGVRLYVADQGFNRILIWNSIPTQNTQAADVVVGQPNMTAAAADNSAQLCPSNGVDQNNAPTYPAICAATLNFPRSVISDGSRMFIADSGNDRVLIYNQIPTTNGVNADGVLGAPDFATDPLVTQDTSIVSTSVDNTGSSDTIATPSSLAYDGTNLYVADPFNRRVLVFTPADIALAPTSTLNAASEVRRQEGFVVLAGTIVANDTVSITINSATYTYTVKSTDTLDTITAGLINQINSANSNSGDPSVIALGGSIADTVYLSSKGVNLGFDTISLSATTSNSADLAATTNGGYLTGGNAGTVAPGSLVEINYSPTSPTAPGLADATVSFDPNNTTPLSETNSLPLTLGGVQVFMDGNPVPLLMVSRTQIKAQVPFEYSNRSTASMYVRITHSDGSAPTITTAAPLVIAPADPGIFAAPSQSNPRPAYAPQHQAGNPTASIVLSLTAVQAGDVATVTVSGRTYSYTVLSTDSGTTITNGLVAAIHDPQVTAAATGANGSIVLTAVQSGSNGTGIPITATTTPASGQSSAGISLTIAGNSATCCSDNNTGPITALNPAQPNETITLYATGLGLVQDTNANPINVVDGAPFNGVQPNSAANSVYATVGGSSGTVVSAGLAPGGIGVYAVQIQLPSGLTSSSATPVYIAQNAFISNTVTIPVGQAAGTLATLIATPNPIVVAAGTTYGQTTLSWNTSSTASVEVHVGGPGGALVATGTGTGSVTTGTWVSDGTIFYLQDASQGNATAGTSTLATVVVHVTQSSGTTTGGTGGTSGGTGSTPAAVFPSTCPASDGGAWVSNSNVSFSGQPSTIQVPMGSSYGQTTITWSVPTSLATSVNIYVGSQAGSLGLFSSGGNASLATTGSWVGDGTVFWLQNSTNGNDQTTGNSLGCIRVAVQQVATPVQQRGTLTATPSTIFTTNPYGQTTLNWNCSSCTSTQVRVGSPTGGLLAVSGGTGSATTGAWVSNGTVFYLVDTSSSNNPIIVSSLTVYVQAPTSSTTTGNSSASGVITATPNPATYAAGDLPYAQTTLTWTCGSCSATEVHVGTPDGPIVSAIASGSGTATTGNWVTDGTVFYLQDASGNNGSSPSSTIGSVTVSVQEAAPVPPSYSNGGTIAADPNPILVNGEFGQTTLTWSCTACTSTEVHVGAPNGPLLSASSLSSGTATTGYWVTNGTVFYLQDASNGNATDPSNTKASVTIETTLQ